MAAEYVRVIDKCDLVPSVVTTHAAEADSIVMSELMHSDKTGYGGRVYWDERDRESSSGGACATGVNRGGTRNAQEAVVNRSRSRIRALRAHEFVVVKRLWSFRKVLLQSG